jgi:hypothetical protein
MASLSGPLASPRRRAINWKGWAGVAFFGQLGPGLVTGAADDDPSEPNPREFSGFSRL